MQGALPEPTTSVPGGVSDVVVHDETGILIQEPSVENLLKAIDRLTKSR